MQSPIRALIFGACIAALLMPGCKRKQPGGGTVDGPGEERGECVLPSSRIENNTTLYKSCSPYILKRGGLDVVYDAVLTIEPGVEVRFNDGDWLEISADFTRGAGIQAKGTKAEPIVLTSRTPEKMADGTWFGLWLNEGTQPGSVVSNVIIRAAGGDNPHIKPTLVHGCLTVTSVPDGTVTLDNVTVENCVNAGVVLRSTRPRIQGMHIKSSGVGVLLDGVDGDLAGADIVYEDVATQVTHGASSRGRAK